MEEQATGGQTLLGSMERVTSTVDAIAEATVTLADGSAAVVTSMDEIRKAAERNAYAATSMNQAAQALEQESLLLRSRSSLFRLPSPAPGGRVRAALRYLDEENFDPAFCQTVPQAILVRTWGEGLVRFGEGTRILPELAERWEIDPSGTLYTFHLRRGVRWHEGGTLAAADVKASFERFLSPATAAPLATLFDAVEGYDAFRAGRTPDVAGLEAPSSALFRVRLSRPVPFFLQLLTLPDITVLPPSLVADPARARRSPSGTGPFVAEGDLLREGGPLRPLRHLLGPGPDRARRRRPRPHGGLRGRRLPAVPRRPARRHLGHPLPRGGPAHGGPRSGGPTSTRRSSSTPRSSSCAATAPPSTTSGSAGRSTTPSTGPR